jgi:phage portal protein BeeE
MGIIQDFKDWRASRKALSQMPQSRGYQAGGGGWGLPYLFSTLAGTKINYAQEVGDLRNVALVQAAVGWVSRNLYDARLRVVELGKDRKEVEIEDSEIADLFARPNPYYSGQALSAGIALSWLMNSEAYLIKVRNRMGGVNELWYEPHWKIRPRWYGSDFVSYYELERDGIWTPIEVDDVIPIQNGVDPDTRRALLVTSAALFREYYTENQASHFMSLLLRNGLVPPIAVSLGDKDNPLTDPDQFNLQKETLLRKVSGDSAGQPFITNKPINAQKLGFDYSSVGLKEVRQIPVNRFCAAMGISPISLHLDAGDSTHANYNNVQGYLKHDYRNYIVPLHKLIAAALDTHLLPEFGEAGKRKCAWDYTQTALMQTDATVDATVATLLYEKGVIKRSEARERVNYKWTKEDEKYANEIGMELGGGLMDDLDGQERDVMPKDDEDEPLVNGKAKVF